MQIIKVLLLTLALTSCGILPDSTPEDKSDQVAFASYTLIGKVQNRAINLNRTNTISDASLRKVLETTIALNELVHKIESAADGVNGSFSPVDCVTVSLSGTVVSACSREDITSILLQLEEYLK